MAVDTLLRRSLILFLLDSMLWGFVMLKELYVKDEDLFEIYDECKKNHSHDNYLLQDEYIFKA